MSENRSALRGERKMPMFINGTPPPLCMWSKRFLTDLNNAQWVAPVSYFKYAPFSSNWEDFAVPNLVIELPIPKTISGKPAYWFGTIYGYAGYKALVTFYPLSTPSPSSSGNPTPSVATWIPFCSSIPKPLGFSFSNKITLHPPTDQVMDADQLAEEINKMFHAIFFREGMAVESVKPDQMELVQEELDRCSKRFTLNELVEALDINDCSRFRLATVEAMAGDRMFIKYVGGDKNDPGFCFSQHSQHIQKFGWCQDIGAELYKLDRGRIIAPPVNQIETLTESSPIVPPGVVMKPQMVFEMIHPVYNYKIVAGCAVEILKNGYFLAATDWTRKEELVEIVLHVTSDLILPVGFCQKHGIPFEGPKMEDDNDPKNFSWKKFLKTNKVTAFDPSHIAKGPNRFVEGCKLEAAGVTVPVNIQPATVRKVADRLIQIYFDGTDVRNPMNFEWVSCDSCNIYPVGYAEMTWHSREGRPDVGQESSH